VWAANFLAHVLVAIAAFIALGGMRRRDEPTVNVDGAGADSGAAPAPKGYWITIVIVSAWIVGIVGFSLPLGPSAFAAAVVLIMARAADENAAFKRMPWNAILMVAGMSVLVSVLEATGGMTLFTTLLAKFATAGTLHGVMAFVTGLISTYSSTSGVVLPTFLPTIPGLVKQVGGGDPLTIALSINVGASIVDVSPLSTLGALCIAAVVDPRQAPDLFRKLMIWGLSMILIGFVLCQLLMGAFARL
jgi:di/tricarboxylate transporter